MLDEREIIVDSFAGGGGASLGIAQALGRAPDVAINHDEAAIVMHAANHPDCKHFTEDVWKASPRRVTRGRPVGLLWASPDCKHHSRAKGSKPVEKNIRSLAWVVVRWADQCRPRVIILENVREFEEWGPLVPRWECQCGWKGAEGQALLARTRRRCPRCESRSLKQTPDMIPDPARLGLTFRRFAGRLRGLGYAVQWRTLNAADFGAPTHRRRLFLIARNDGDPIEWPEPTHGDPRKLYKSDDPVGLENDKAILDLVGVCPVIVAAWGVHGKLRDRDRHVMRLLINAGVEPVCLGATQQGYPLHPLYLPAHLQPKVYGGRCGNK